MDLIIFTYYTSFIFFGMQEKLQIFFFRVYQKQFYSEIENKLKFHGNLTSLLHSLLNTIGMLYIFFSQWDQFSINLTNLDTFESTLLFSFSLGYFIYDTLSMQIKGFYEHDKTLIIHHLMTIFCMSRGLFQQNFHGMMILISLAEINSIFLHLRTLIRQGFKFQQVPSIIRIYQYIMILNYVTFLFFRLIPEFYVLYKAFYLVNTGISKSITIVGVICIQILNFHLFYKIIKSEMKSKKKIVYKA
eukprot:gene2503-3209_t